MFKSQVKRMSVLHGSERQEAIMEFRRPVKELFSVIVYTSLIL